MFHAAAETVKIASSWILISNKKTGCVVGAAVREAENREPKRAKRRKEEVLGLTDVRTDRSPSQDIQQEGSRFAAGAHLFFLSLRHHRGYTYAGRTHYFPSVPLCETFFHI